MIQIKFARGGVVSGADWQTCRPQTTTARRMSVQPGGLLNKRLQYLFMCYCSQGPRVSRDQPRKLEFEERNETQICLSVRRCIVCLDSGPWTLVAELSLRLFACWKGEGQTGQLNSQHATLKH